MEKNGILKFKTENTDSWKIKKEFGRKKNMDFIGP